MTSEDRRIMWGLSNAVVCDTGIGEIRQLKLIVFLMILFFARHTCKEWLFGHIEFYWARPVAPIIFMRSTASCHPTARWKT